MNKDIDDINKFLMSEPKQEFVCLIHLQIQK